MESVAHLFLSQCGWCWSPHLTQLVCGLFSCNVVNTKMLLCIVHQVEVLVAYCSGWAFGLNLCSVLQNRGKSAYSGQKLETPDELALKWILCIAFYMLLNDFSNLNKICGWEGVYMHTCVSKQEKNLVY